MKIIIRIIGRAKYEIKEKVEVVEEKEILASDIFVLLENLSFKDVMDIFKECEILEN
jgi:hypothetical protein